MHLTNTDYQAMGTFFGCIAIFGIIFLAFYVWLFWRILTKAGYSPWLSLLNLVPFGALILILILAFGQWPSQTPAPTQTTYGYAPATGTGYIPPVPPIPATPAPAAPTVPPVYEPPVVAPAESTAPPAPPTPPAEAPAAPPAEPPAQQ